MCYACNPQCGTCKPKKIVAAPCKFCGTEVALKREEFLVLFDLPCRDTILIRKLREKGVDVPRCSTCGNDASDALCEAMPPAPCTRSRIVCGFPCGRRNDPCEEGAAPCPFMVPVEKLE